MLFLDSTDNSLKKLLEECSIYYSEVDIITAQDTDKLANIESFSSLIIHNDCLKNFDKELTQFISLFTSVIGVGPQSEILVLDNQIANFDETKKDQINLFKNMVNFFYNLEYKSEDFNQDLSKLNNQVAGLLERVGTELERVKGIHKAFVPVRKTDVRGLHFQTKFLTGLKSGGDFFDIIEEKNQLTLLMSSVNKYSASSILLSHFLEIKQLNEITPEVIEKMIDNISNDYQSANTNDDLEMGLLCLTINLKSFEMKGYSYGDFRIVYEDGTIVKTKVANVDGNKKDIAKIDCKMKRDNRVLILSPGVSKNWAIKNSDNIDLRIQKFFKYGQDEILNELFYDLKRDDIEKFLDYDSSAVYMEINNNALFSV
jgi:hypothetical protein